MAKTVIAWIAGLLIALLYAYAVVTGIGNLVGMTGLGSALGGGLSTVGWFWLGFGIAMPALVFALCLLVARGRGKGIRILILAAGLALVAAVQLDIMHVVPESLYFA
ncbi:hypothetical protein D3248_06175 [Leucobacter zeae]|nr:hypothetical protein [Leucobacter zeae]